MEKNVFKMPDKQANETERDYHIRTSRNRLVDTNSWREVHFKKSRNRINKCMSLKEAVQEFVIDGDIISDTGFSWVRGCTQAFFEMIRQEKRELTLMGAPIGVGGIPIGGGIIGYMHNSYTGAEMRGIDKMFHRSIKEKKVEPLSEWSHGAQALGFKAAQMGVPYLASKVMLGSDMVKHNPYVKISSHAFKDEPEKDMVCLIPALYPDIVFIHVQKADKYGNAMIWGPVVNDIALSVASRKVVITCEELVSEDEIRNNTSGNSIPFMYVDAVVEMPFGNVPGSVPGYYYWHRQWWEQGVRIAFQSDENFNKFLDYWVFSCRDHYDFVDKLGGGIREIVKRNKLTKVAEGLNDIGVIDYDYKEVNSEQYPYWRYPWEESYEQEINRQTETLLRLKNLEEFEQSQNNKGGII